MPIISLDKVSLAYGHVPLLDRVDLQLEAGERACLVGRNGAGKSTLMRVLGGEAVADDGVVWHQPGLRMSYLGQAVPTRDGRTVFQLVTDGLGQLSGLLRAYHETAAQLSRAYSEEGGKRLAELQHELEAADGWLLEQRVESVISRLQLPAGARVDELSGGAKRRAMLARALVGEPELLLLDEPTNHLDIDSILWLEQFLLDFPGALLFVTHDRSFVRRLATRIIELDRGHLTSWPGEYDRYLARKQERLEVESAHEAKFDKVLAQEEAWIRQGIKARRTRNEGRVRALQALRAERARRRQRQGAAAMHLDSGELSGKLVIEAEDLGFSYRGTPIVRDFSTRIMRGDRIGIIGPNGIGKTTLVRLLLGQLPPDSGRVRLGTRLQTAYFDQEREQLDPEATVFDSLAEGRESVEVNGRPVHVISYLRDFLFPAERARSPVKSLSGGERARLLLARLFTRPANLLVLDEPTNDLDMETLELLEELLAQYDGTLIVISHDRAFLDNVVSSSLVFEGHGRVSEYVGGYSDWLRQRDTAAAKAVPRQPSSTSPGARAATKKSAAPAQGARKLSYKEQRELEALPEQIERLETEQAVLEQRAADPDLYKQEGDEIAAVLKRLEEVGTELEAAYVRWELLEDR
ncbi:MAG: ATP-binding cassette domain-containing protein [Gammaproteobacteria bacterium]